MPGTKILNVQKNDSFTEVFDAFAETQAKEVIFILPKGSVFARDNAHLAAIKNEAEKSGKTISVMSSDPIIVELASINDVAMLQSPAPRKRAQPIIEPSEPVVAELALAKNRPAAIPVEEDQGKKIKDIVGARDEHDLAVEGSDAQEESIEISRTPLIPAEPPKPLNQDVQNTQNKSQIGIADIEKLWEEEEKRQNPDASFVNDKPKKKFFGSVSKKFIFIPLVVAVAVLAVILYATLGSAKIIVKPLTQEIDFNIKGKASTQIQEVQSEFNNIPAQQFIVEKSASGTFPTSSEKEVAQKASGKITIYSTSASSQPLIATTRFAADDGKIFRISETITVPASGSVEVIVYANKPGDEYNIGPTKFVIPGLEGTPKYDQFYAISTVPMGGGRVGVAKVVSEQDYLNAKDKLTAEAKEMLESALTDQLSGLKTFDTHKVVVNTPVVNAKVGEAADTLEMTVSASATVIAFRDTDMYSLIQAYLDKTGNIELIENGLDIAYLPGSSETGSGSFQFEAQVKGRAASKIDMGKIKTDVKGKNESEIRTYFDNLEGIVSARILLSPFWVRRVPDDLDKIEITIDIS